MGNEIIIALLAFGFIGSLSAVFVLWSKLDEQKKLTQEERDRRWDEISRAAGLENKLDKAKREYEQAVLFWRDTAEESVEYEIQRDALQDRLSSLLCPHNDHIWVDGICLKCGRMHE